MREVISAVLMLILLSACSSDDSKRSNQHDLSNSDSLATATDDTTEIDKELLLEPGISAGKINLGQDANEIYAELGKADAGDAGMQKSVAIWYKNHDPKSYATSIYTVRDTGDNPAARIQQVRVTSPEFQTKDGIGVSSTLEKIKQIYRIKKVTDVTDGGEVLVMYDSMAGIAFETNIKGICKAVIIHKSNEGLKKTSLPLR